MIEVVVGEWVLKDGKETRRKWRWKKCNIDNWTDYGDLTRENEMAGKKSLR